VHCLYRGHAFQMAVTPLIHLESLALLPGDMGPYDSQLPFLDAFSRPLSKGKKCISAVLRRDKGPILNPVPHNGILNPMLHSVRYNIFWAGSAGIREQLMYLRFE
jgi:hypothetical protein